MANGNGNGTRERVEWAYRSMIIAGLTLVGFFAQQTWQDMREMQGRLLRIEIELAKNYVTRQEFGDRINQIEEELTIYRGNDP